MLINYKLRFNFHNFKNIADKTKKVQHDNFINKLTCVYLHVQRIHIYITTVLLLYMNTYIVSAIWVCFFFKKKRHNISLSTSRSSNQWSLINLYNSR